MAAQPSVRPWARLCGDPAAKTPVEDILTEKRVTDQKLNELSETVNSQAHDTSGAERVPSAGAGRS